MAETILITGSTDGIGLLTAEALAARGHDVLLHGRDPRRLEDAKRIVLAHDGGGSIEGFLADLSRLEDVAALADAVVERHSTIDVLINNAGIYRSPHPTTEAGLDVRFVVNAIAPYLLTTALLPLLGPTGRVVNLSSAAQDPVDLQALVGQVALSDGEAYAQSKLAITMWSRELARTIGDDGPVVVAVNPGSMLGTKMVQEGFGVQGHDIGIGADILTRAALSAEFANASGQYFDNDSGRFASPHPDALDPLKSSAVVGQIEAILADRAT